MKIIHVVTYIDGQCSFGGPVRVAFNQAEEMQQRGHDVTVVAATGRNKDQKIDFSGIPTRLFPAYHIKRLGFSGYISPGLYSWMRANIADADVVHVHLARDLVTLPAAYYCYSHKVPYVLQPHWMIDPTDNLLATVADKLVTRKVISNARKIFAVTDTEISDIQKVVPGYLNCARLTNGISMHAAVQEPDESDIVFLGRLHRRKRPGLFVKMAKDLVNQGVKARFSIIGPDEGELEGIVQSISSAELTESIFYEGALPPSDTCARLDRASILVMPTKNELFGMAILEAMSRERPVVVDETCGLASVIQQYDCGIVVNGSYEKYAEAVATLLRDKSMRQSMGKNGRRVVARRYSITSVVDDWESQVKASGIGLR